MAIVTLLLITLVVAAPSAFAVQHIVGDSSGWTNFGDYTTWASSNTFNVGDTLLFSYSSSHGVDVVSKDDYDNCATSNAISSYTGGSTTIKLTQPGPMYFACPSFGHCSTGMKLAINVVSPGSSNSPATTTPSSSDNNLTPPSTTSPSTPSTSTPSSKSANSANHNMVVGFSLILAPLFVLMC
uniref:mavicyanin-like n=1 Tax=Erigeron canadensis TaxID=72917 RepID=UPI001CB910C5|nr:mavicyanin-like [Erigeron canadensis]